LTEADPRPDESPASAPPAPVAGMPAVRAVDTRAPWRWLAAGWEDLRAAPGPSLFYGAVLATMGFLLTHSPGKGAVELAFLTGFLIVGPFLLMGLYDISRRVRRGERVMLGPTLTAWQANVPAIGFYALILALLLAVWIRISIVVVALFFEGAAPSIGALARSALDSPDTLAFVAVYAAAGAGFALLVFATSAVSLPLLLDRPQTDTVTAMIVSFNAVRTSFRPMLLWAAIVVALTAAGFATFYLGLVVALPLVGHATWHAYRDVVA
jgi:uncharacterized membrane protein